MAELAAQRLFHSPPKGKAWLRGRPAPTGPSPPKRPPPAVPPPKRPQRPAPRPSFAVSTPGVADGGNAPRSLPKKRSPDDRHTGASAARLASILLEREARGTPLRFYFSNVGDAPLTAEELWAALKRGSGTQGLTRADVWRVCETMDGDGDGRVSRRELERFCDRYRGSPPPRPARAPPPPPPSAGPEAARLQALLDACEAAGVRLRRALDAASGRRPVTAAELHRGLRRCGGSFSDVTRRDADALLAALAPTGALTADEVAERVARARTRLSTASRGPPTPSSVDSRTDYEYDVESDDAYATSRRSSRGTLSSRGSSLDDLGLESSRPPSSDFGPSRPESTRTARSVSFAADADAATPRRTGERTPKTPASPTRQVTFRADARTPPSQKRRRGPLRKSTPRHRAPTPEAGDDADDERFRPRPTPTKKPEPGFWDDADEVPPGLATPPLDDDVDGILEPYISPSRDSPRLAPPPSLTRRRADKTDTMRPAPVRPASPPPESPVSTPRNSPQASPPRPRVTPAKRFSPPRLRNTTPDAPRSRKTSDRSPAAAARRGRPLPAEPARGAGRREAEPARAGRRPPPTKERSPARSAERREPAEDRSPARSAGRREPAEARSPQRAAGRTPRAAGRREPEEVRSPARAAGELPGRRRARPRALRRDGSPRRCGRPSALRGGHHALQEDGSRPRCGRPRAAAGRRRGGSPPKRYTTRSRRTGARRDAVARALSRETGACQSAITCALRRKTRAGRGAVARALSRETGARQSAIPARALCRKTRAS